MIENSILESLHTGSAMARSLRIAFFVEENEYSDSVLESIFTDCYSRWGGRYNLIIPCKSGAIDESYAAWLELYDPDFIYSYAQLKADEIDKVHIKYGPAKLIIHPEINDNLSTRDFNPRWYLNFISSLSVSILQSRHFFLSQQNAISIVDCMPNVEPHPFMSLNLGTYIDSFHRWPLPPNISDIIKTVTYIGSKDTERKIAGLKVSPASNGVATSIQDLLMTMSLDKNLYGVAQLSADSTPRIHLPINFDDSFVLVIGNSYADKILFWNHRSLMPHHIGREFASLIIDPKWLDEEQFLPHLVEFMKKRNTLTTHPAIKVLSASLPVNEIQDIIGKFKALDPYNYYQIESPRDEVNLGEVVTSSVHRNAQYGGGGYYYKPANHRMFEHRQGRVGLPSLKPDHIDGRRFGGAWAIDIELETDSLFGKKRWQLPRKLRMHGAFEPNVDFSRTLVHGGISLVVTHENYEQLYLKIPSQEYAFRYAIESGLDWSNPKSERQPPFKNGAYEWSSLSDKGRYLKGLTGLFGQAETASQYLMSKYWYEVFTFLSGAGAEGRLEMVVKTLKRRIKNLNVETDDVWEKIGKVVLSEAKHVRNPDNYITFSTLEAKHRPYLEEAQQELESRPTPEDETQRWMDYAKESLARGIQFLCANDVMMQGYQWRCDECYHNNWSAIDNLKVKLECDVCGKTTSAPVNKPWHFKLNGFVQAALREHGVLPVIWALRKLGSDRARYSFYYLPSYELYDEYPKSQRALPSRESDLMCVVDGKFFLVEAKSSLSSIDLNSTIELAARLKPDVVMLAVMETASPKYEEKIRELKALLLPLKIAGEGICLDLRDFDSAELL